MKNFFRSVFAPIVAFFATQPEPEAFFPAPQQKRLPREKMPESMRVLRVQHERERKEKAIRHMMEKQGIREFYFEHDGKMVKIVARNEKNANRKFLNLQQS